MVKVVAHTHRSDKKDLMNSFCFYFFNPKVLQVLQKVVTNEHHHVRFKRKTAFILTPPRKKRAQFLKGELSPLFTGSWLMGVISGWN